ncbi:MAG: dihydrofolate reductase [Prevotella sp.]|nr:dihydrofolate reductase [Prevotella sp.]
MTISIIVAIAKNRAIGFQGQMPWHLPEDLKHFKKLTLNHSIIMGRKTWESLPNGALPKRRNIVVSRSVEKLEGGEVFSSLEDALEACKTEEEVFIIGGGTIYQQAMPLAHRIYLTSVDTVPAEADTFFPEIDERQWQQTKKEKHDGFSFIEYELRM